MNYSYVATSWNGTGEATAKSIRHGRWRMKTKFVGYAAMVMVLLVVAIPLMAHHGTGVSYDMKKVTVLKGVVTRFAFANPHSQLYFDVTDDKGNVQHWVLEGNSASLSDAGWHKTTIKPGDVVIVDVMPPKNGALIGRVRRILRPDGTVLADAHLPSTLNDVAPPPKKAEKPPADSNSDGSR